MRKTLIASGLAFVGLALALKLRRRYSLEGRVVLVTGGGRGLGLQVAREAARRGAKVGLCARSAEELEVAKAELEAAGAAVATAVCDVRDDASVTRAFAEVVAALGPVDVLCNVAGIISVGPIEALTIADFRDSMDTNFMGAVRATYAVLPGMRARKSGRIVNVTSLGGEIAIPHMLPYCASKFAFVGFSEGLHAEVARDGVRVVTVVPGLMRTGSPPQATFAGQPAKEYVTFALSDATPLTSVGVEHAARMILDGTERGALRVVISLQAKLAVLLNGVVPNAVIGAMTASGRLLPDASEHPARASGFESESPLTRSPLTAMSRAATASQHEDVQQAPVSPN